MYPEYFQPRRLATLISCDMRLRCRSRAYPLYRQLLSKRMESNANQHPVGMISKMCLPRYACFCCSPASKIKESGCLKNQHVLQHESSRNGQEKKATTSLLSRPCLFQFYLLLLHQLSNDFEAMIGVSLPRLPVCMSSSSLAKASGHPQLTW